MNQRLLTKAERANGYGFKFELNGLMRGDAAARAAYYNIMILAGIMTRNEARRLEGLNPLPGLDHPIYPLNMATVSEDGQTAPAPLDLTQPDERNHTNGHSKNGATPVLRL